MNIAMAVKRTSISGVAQEMVDPAVEAGGVVAGGVVAGGVVTGGVVTGVVGAAVVTGPVTTLNLLSLIHRFGIVWPGLRVLSIWVMPRA